MSTYFPLSMSIDLLDQEDCLLSDEALTTYLEEFYEIKALKKDRLKRFRV